MTAVEQYILTQDLAQAVRRLAWAKQHDSQLLRMLYEQHIAAIEKTLEQGNHEEEDYRRGTGDYQFA